MLVLQSCMQPCRKNQQKNNKSYCHKFHIVFSLTAEYKINFIAGSHDMINFRNRIVRRFSHWLAIFRNTVPCFPRLTCMTHFSILTHCSFIMLIYYYLIIYLQPMVTKLIIHITDVEVSTSRTTASWGLFRCWRLSGIIIAMFFRT